MSASHSTKSGQDSPRDNVVFEAGLFGGTLGMRRTRGETSSDLLGLTCVRYDDATNADEMRIVNEKLRKAIESENRVARIEGLWWQFSLTERSIREPSAVSLLRISRGRDGALELAGRAWQEDGCLSTRYWSEAVKETKGPPASVGRDGRDRHRVRRSRGRVLYNSFGHSPESQRADIGCLQSRRS